MVETKDDTLKGQVESRLDYLFDEGRGSREVEASSGEFSLNPLKPLKAVLLSIDWEITDDTMTSFLREVKRLEETFKEEKIPLTFLQLLASIGKYIKLNKGKAHPNTVRLMDSVYTSLDKVVMSEMMPQADKEKLLLEEVAKFKKLKEEIALRRASREAEKAKGAESLTPPPQSIPTPEGEKPWLRPDVAKMSAHEAFAFALEEIKDLIRAEFKALRAEITLWRESE